MSRSIRQSKYRSLWVIRAKRISLLTIALIRILIRAGHKFGVSLQNIPPHLNPYYYSLLFLIWFHVAQFRSRKKIFFWTFKEKKRKKERGNEADDDRGANQQFHGRTTRMFTPWWCIFRCSLRWVPFHHPLTVYARNVKMCKTVERRTTMRASLTRQPYREIIWNSRCPFCRIVLVVGFNNVTLPPPTPWWIRSHNLWWLWRTDLPHTT